jgi:YfiH family protein
VNGETARATLGTVLRDAALDWIVPDWPASANVRAFATTRAGGVSAGSYASMNLGRNSRDDPAALAENQRRFEKFLPAKPAMLGQLQGAAVATLPRAGSMAPAPVADAAVTRERGVVCAILTADCLPVLFADRAGTAVGVAHAGWRGLVAGVLEATIAALRDLGAEPGDLMASLGPAIGPAAFEVGEDVFSAFCTGDPSAAAYFAPHRPGKWHADLYGLARQRLARRGVTRVYGGGFCTFTDSARFFSYRRERESGRMATAIWLDR